MKQLMTSKNIDIQPLIFIVEDDPIYCELLRNELEVHGFEQIDVFSTGQAAVEQLYRMPNIILLDYHLEGDSNGLDVLQLIKVFNPDIQILMMSAQDNIEVAVNSMKYGAYDYVIKNDSAMPRMMHLLGRIMRWNSMLAKNRQSRKIKKTLTIACGMVISASVLFSILV